MQIGYHSVLVLSGGTREEDLKRYAFGPEIVVESLADYAGRLEKVQWRTRGSRLAPSSASPTPAVQAGISDLALAIGSGLSRCS